MYLNSYTPQWLFTSNICLAQWIVLNMKNPCKLISKGRIVQEKLPLSTTSMCSLQHLKAMWRAPVNHYTVQKGKVNFARISKSYKRVQEIFGTFTLPAQIKNGMKATCSFLGNVSNLIMSNSSTYSILQKNHLKHHSDCCEWTLQKAEGQNTNRPGKREFL